MTAFALAATALLPQAAAQVARAVEVSVQLPEDTELPDLRERSFVYAADGSLLAVLHDEEDRRVVPLEALPDHVWQAVLTAEDRRFFEHDGYDPEGITRAFFANVRAGGVTQGGSTITQQLAKNNFLDGSQTLDRKLTELLYALALEKDHDKEDLLERYLNQVYFGAGAYGVEAAAEEYFGVSAADLRPDQSALLASLVRAPSLYNPRTNPDDALARRNRMLSAMADEGYLNEPLAATLADTELGVVESRDRPVREPYVVEEVKRQFLADPEFGETRDERRERLFGGGLEIHTTIDPELQDIARDVVASQFPEGAPTAAIATVDPTSGAVRAVHSGASFEDEQFDLATQGRRQPGSAYKTFTMVEALRQGFPVGLTLESPHPMEFEADVLDEPWEVRNYGGSSYGSIDLAEATRRSVNTYYAQLWFLVGADNVIGLTEELGIDPAAYAGQAYPAISVGGLARGIKPIEMASAYGTLANDGVHHDWHLIEEITDEGGEVYVHESAGHDAIPSVVNGVALDLLTEVVEQGTGTAARLPGWQVAGKTGTTNDNADAWFAGVTPVLSTSVWVGHTEGQITMPGATGGAVAAPVWHDFMERALEGVEPEEFPEVDRDALADAFEGEEVEVPDVVGMAEADAVAALAEARLAASVSRVDAHAPAGEVVGQSPSGGSMAQLASTVSLQVSTGRPPSVSVPNVVGSSEQQAVATLQGAGFGVSVRRVSADASAGQVVAQSPGAGASAERGATVAIDVSTGPADDGDDDERGPPDDDDDDEGPPDDEDRGPPDDAGPPDEDDDEDD